MSVGRLCCALKTGVDNRVVPGVRLLPSRSHGSVYLPPAHVLIMIPKFPEGGNALEGQSSGGQQTAIPENLAYAEEQGHRHLFRVVGLRGGG